MGKEAYVAACREPNEILLPLDDSIYPTPTVLAPRCNVWLGWTSGHACSLIDRVPKLPTRTYSYMVGWAAPALHIYVRAPLKVARSGKG
jgi:hypothetical protein